MRTLMYFCEVCHNEKNPDEYGKSIAKCIQLYRTEELKKLGNDYTMRMYPDIFPTTFGVFIRRRLRA
ncbi:hypothetical protein THAOC_19023 [Thalassiosira oceanica]|uniref:Uncharacterized protein n=1 Tax=Thalassiosira oceanica TaxID=159749 RepID=K0S3D2_THAOC|nr:hypothetical protein THAOC_19023 [Thalassiosira oceanica]|eukprot:EJK60593.1 hypothetical protein THAOC_19023 [Thalassiosira oceanica]